ncbi:hypothetical protein TNCV_1479341 [Trichonephila clavipes]|nr:hypothetical protein TNCV_1479341 [Trichonephila clavipes]
MRRAAQHLRGAVWELREKSGFCRVIGMQPLGVGGADVRDFEVKTAMRAAVGIGQLALLLLEERESA